MHKTHELRLATRMERLGTETAFEVLVKAKALEAQGRDIIHLEIGEPDFDTPSNMVARYSVNARREGSRPTRKRHVASPTIRVKAGQTK